MFEQYALHMPTHCMEVLKSLNDRILAIARAQHGYCRELLIMVWLVVASGSAASFAKPIVELCSVLSMPE